MFQLLDPGDKTHTFIYAWSVAEPVQALPDSGVNNIITRVGRDLCSRQEQQCGHKTAQGFIESGLENL